MDAKRAISIGILGMVYALAGCGPGPSTKNSPPFNPLTTTPPGGKAFVPAPLQAVALDVSLVSDATPGTQVLVLASDPTLTSPLLVVTDTTGAIVTRVGTVTTLTSGLAFHAPAPKTKPLVYQVSGRRSGLATVSNTITGKPFVAGAAPSALLQSPATGLAPTTAPAAQPETAITWTDVGAPGGYIVVLTAKSPTNVDTEEWIVELAKGTSTWTPGGSVESSFLSGPAPLSSKTLYMVSVVSMDLQGWGTASSSSAGAPSFFTTP
jgi:hypothetical protein